jgi:glycosyltransferase involved in cell wall biosynthesis
VINICMLVKDRPRLTEQALASLIENTAMDHTLTIVDDGSGVETKELLRKFIWKCPMAGIVGKLSSGPGVARNAGIIACEKAFDKDGYLYLCDNDCYFLPGWDTALLAAWPIAKQMGFKALGGYAHAYQQPISTQNGINELAALGLLSWLMDWETWDKYGPFDPSPDINGSEDWLYSQKIRRDGFKVGALAEPVIINCGATSSNGKPCPGASTLYEQKIPPGVLIL